MNSKEPKKLDPPPRFDKVFERGYANMCKEEQWGAMNSKEQTVEKGIQIIQKWWCDVNCNVCAEEAIKEFCSLPNVVIVQADEDGLIDTPTQNACFPGEKQLQEYLATPDDDVAKSLTYEQKKTVAKYILYGLNCIKAQKALDDKDKKEAIEGILEEITESFVEVVANFYMDKDNCTRTFELWKAIKSKTLEESK